MRRLSSTSMIQTVALGAVFAVIATVIPASTVQAQTQWSRSSSPEDLIYRLDQLSAEIADMRASVGGGGTAVRSTGSGDVGQLEGEIRRLTAKVERLENQIRQLSQNTENQLGDVIFRLNELEGVPNDGAESPQLVPNQDATVAAAQGAVSVSEQGDLDRAIGDVNQGRFDQAEDRLRQFLNTYPSSPLVGEAWYWLGESQFVRGNLADAARSYLNGYQIETAGSYAPQNLYKLGTTLGRLGQLREACSTLTLVRQQFPNAPDGIPNKADAEADNLTCG